MALPAEHLRQPGSFAVDDPASCLRCPVAWGQAGAAGGDDYVDISAGAEGREDGLDPVLFVRHQLGRDQFYALTAEEVRQ